MSNDKVISFEDRAIVESCSALDELARLGAQKMLQAALGNEVAEYSERHASEKDESGRRLVARNGVMPRRTLVSGVGPLEIRQPGVNDRREWERFSSKVLPPFLRRLPSLDNVIPVLYLKGVSMGDSCEAMQATLGERAYGLSATYIVHLKQQWEKDHQNCCPLSFRGANLSMV